MGRVTAGPDEHFRATVASWVPAPGRAEGYYGVLLELFDAQALSRHLDLEARRLFAAGEGFYTIGSAGHESNAAVAMALRPTDPALLHYRSGGLLLRPRGAGAGRRPGARRAAGADRLAARADLRRPPQGVRQRRPARDPPDLDDRLPPAAGGRPGLRAAPGAAHSAWPRPGPRTPSSWPASATPRSTTPRLSAPSTQPATPYTPGCRCRCWSCARTTAGASRSRARRAGWRRRCRRDPASPTLAADGADPVATLEAACGGGRAGQVDATAGRPAPAHRAVPRTRRFRRRAGLPAPARRRGRPRPRPAARHRAGPVAAGMPPTRGARPVRRRSRPGVADGRRRAARRAPHVGGGGDAAARAADAHRPLSAPPSTARSRSRAACPRRPARSRWRSR